MAILLEDLLPRLVFLGGLGEKAAKPEYVKLSELAPFDTSWSPKGYIKGSIAFAQPSYLPSNASASSSCGGVLGIHLSDDRLSRCTRLNT